MRPFAKDTHGRNHYFSAPKEHKIPKSAASRRGTRTALRQAQKQQLRHALRVNA